MAQKTWKDFWQAFRISFGFLALLFIVFFVDVYLRGQSHGLGLSRYGILPRTKDGLIGIICSPLLHANLEHLLANSLPLFSLLILLFWDRKYRPSITLTVIWILSGLGTWLIGRNYAEGHPIYHVGASSLIYGIVAYLIATAFWQHRWRSAIIAIIVFLVYGGIVWGALPQAGEISWEGHLSGMLAGIWCAHSIHS